MKTFLDTINYASCNEDGRSECRALALGPDDAVLCVTGSGARPLDLLTQQPARIVAVDVNPCQHHLLRLKVAAIRRLDYDACLAFLGVMPSTRRLATYVRLRADLPPPARAFWDDRERTVASGVLYAGRWEQHFRLLARLVGGVRPRLRRRLFAAVTIQEQRAAWSRWRRGLWLPFLRLTSSRLVWRYLLRDPAFFRFVPGGLSIGAHFDAVLSRAARCHLFRESAFATLLFFGRYRPGGPLPLHLQRRHYATLQDGVDRIQFVVGSLPDVLATSAERFSAFSLSDIGSYLDAATHRRLWEGIRRTAWPGARVCERYFLVRHGPDAEAAGLVRDRALEATLARDDRSFFYTFVAGRLAGGSHA